MHWTSINKCAGVQSIYVFMDFFVEDKQMNIIDIENLLV